MIKFEAEDNGQSISIFIDTNGINQLLFYLKTLENKKDHIHLNSGHHLIDEPPIEGEITVKHVKIIFDENI